MRAVTEIGTHWLDLAEYLTGERITSGRGLFGCFQPQRMLKDGMTEPPEAAEGVPSWSVRSEDSALLHFRMAGGAIGSAVLSEVSRRPHQPPEPGNHRQKPQPVVGQRGQHRPARSLQGQRGADRPLPLRLQRLHRYLYHAGRALLMPPWAGRSRRGRGISPPLRTGRGLCICAGRWSAAPRGNGARGGRVRRRGHGRHSEDH